MAASHAWFYGGVRWRSSKIFIFIVVAYGLFVDSLLYGIVIPCLPFILEDELGIPKDRVQGHTSNLLTTYAVTCVVTAPFVGFISDRIGSRTIPFLASIAGLLAANIMFFLGRSIAILYIARVFQGVGAALGYTSGFALLFETVGTDDLGKSSGLVFGLISAGALLSPTLGGSIYTKAGSRSLLIFGCAMLVPDLALRLLVLDTNRAKRHLEREGDPMHASQDTGVLEANEADLVQRIEDAETRTSQARSENFELSTTLPRIVRRLPILACLSSPRFLVALLTNLLQATIISSFEATIPLTAADLFGFDALKSGYLFVPLSLAEILASALLGWVVDKIGAKTVGAISFAYITPMLVLLRICGAGGTNQIVLFCALLALIGIGIGGAGVLATVEAGIVLEKMSEANPHVYGNDVPYAQMFSMLEMCYHTGLTLGPELGGGLRRAIGFGNMAAVIGGICAVAAILCYRFLGSKFSGRAVVSKYLLRVLRSPTGSS